MRRKQACRGRGRPRKKPNVVSERLVSERVVSEKVVNEKEGAFLNFVSQNIEGNDIGWNQSDDEDHNDEEFNPEMEIDSGNSSASSMGSDWSYGDQNVSSVDRTVQRLIRKYGEVNLQMENSSKKIDVAQTKPLQVFGSWSRFQHEQEAPSHDPRCNKKELSASLSVIKRVMKMDAAVPFNIPVDPIALRLHDYFDVIDTPMDFGTICNHLENGTKYTNSEDVFKDVQCIWKNCCNYYNEGNFILDLMKRVKEKFMTYWTAAGLCIKEPGTSSVLTSSNMGKRRTRGPTRNLKLAQIPIGERFEISWRNRRAVGESSTFFKAECTALVRQTQDLPLQVKSWKEIPFDIKKKAFEHMLKRFKVEDHMTWVLDQIHRSYHNYRHHLKKMWYETCETTEEARKKVPPNVADDDWQYLINLWSSPEWQSMSMKNKENGSKNNIIHTSGSKSFSQIREEERKKTGNDPGRTLLWELTHVRPDGLAANPASQEALSKLKKLYTQISAENSQMTEDEIFVKVFGPERSSRVRGYGDGVTPKELWGPSSSSSSTVNELRRQLEESKQRQEESEQRSAAEVQGLKEQLGRVEGLLSAQMNRFEGLLVQLTSHMHSPAQIERCTEISLSRNGRPRTTRPRR
ncbi:PREDICTED: uncharacterized protein LOC103319022 isoform X1 [Prunus mume]|uniref:Uncharacterized protein LOC103319022 isoform X1 n=1 Tax=Prunus mume TaxID=102107 RepID=A0ABM0N2Y0_PRUMU|nr:PREDICTED: uncharacterized protein LOC103319022 isoform X1 [Prunus mume]XP_008218736.1 PREDICTED: uncharacterized protein LOC103319022 isoform X1 [Prunus mume]